MKKMNKIRYMVIIEDLHNHTYFSKDAKEKPENYLESAAVNGIEYLGLSEHIDLDPSDKEFGYYKYAPTRIKYNELKHLYENRLTLLFATELTYQSFLHSAIINEVISRPYDYIIGSVHRIMGFTISGIHGIEYFAGKSEYDAYMPYFEELLNMVETNFYDIVGHLDVIKRYGTNFYGTFHIDRYIDILTLILKKVIEKGKVIEINSSGFRQGLDEPYPSKEIISLYQSLGGKEVVFGSDAHDISQFGFKLAETMQLTLAVYDFDIISYNMREKVYVGKISKML